MTVIGRSRGMASLVTLLVLLLGSLTFGSASAPASAATTTAVRSCDTSTQRAAARVNPDRSFRLATHPSGRQAVVARGSNFAATISVLAAEGSGGFVSGLRARLSMMRGDAGAIRLGRAPEYYGGQLTRDQAMDAAEQWLGEGYSEVSPGRYLSQDGMRVVRYGAHETRSAMEHIHFEAYENGFVVENTYAEIVP